MSRNRIKEPSRPAQNSRYYRGRPFSAKARVQSERSVGQNPGHINGKVLAQRIRILRKWSAHDDEITSITYCAGRKQLITGSSDTSVSVWTLKGDHVGTFGQRHGYFKHADKIVAWDIDDKTTWKSFAERHDPFKQHTERSNIETSEQVDSKLLSEASSKAAVTERSKDTKIDDTLPSCNESSVTKNTFGNESKLDPDKEELREQQLCDDLYKLKKINHYKRIYGTHHKLSAEDQLFNMRQKYLSKRNYNFKGGWHGRAGKQNTDIWMQLRVPHVVKVPANLGKFIHRPLREKRIHSPKRKKKMFV